jgi:uncharacterized small protein (DUF1192 family)
METEQLIPILEFARHYGIEVSFIDSLREVGLIEIITVGDTQYVHEDRISDMERMIRLHYGLEINLEGVDAVSRLLERIDLLQREIAALKNRLRLYEA